jgi:hypothetical protein
MDGVFHPCVYDDDFVNNCSPETFYCSTRNDNSFRLCEYACVQLTNISAQTPWHSTRIGTAYVPSECWLSDILNHPIVENVVRILHICMVYHHYEVSYVPVSIQNIGSSVKSN